MAIKTWRGLPLFDDGTTLGEIMDTGGKANWSTGAIPRDYKVQPLEAFAPPSEMDLIPESEYSDRIKEQEERQSSLEHIYLSGPGGTPQFVNLDQNGQGYCWAYSTGHAIMFARMRDHLPYVRLNPHAAASIIKGGRDEGGWCGLSAEFARKNGYAEEGDGDAQWPLQSMDLRYDTPACRERMARYKVTEDWVDLSRPVYDQDLSDRARDTCLLSNQPTMTDYSWWGHSVCAIRLVEVEPGSYGTLIINSWKDWGRYGLAVLQGSKRNTMGAVCQRVVRGA